MSLTASAVFEPTMIGKPYALDLAFQPRGEIDAVAQHRIVEAQVGPHVADHADAGVQADADIERNEGVAAVLAPPARAAVEPSIRSSMSTAASQALSWCCRRRAAHSRTP